MVPPNENSWTWEVGQWELGLAAQKICTVQTLPRRPGVHKGGGHQPHDLLQLWAHQEWHHILPRSHRIWAWLFCEHHWPIHLKRYETWEWSVARHAGDHGTYDRPNERNKWFRYWPSECVLVKHWYFGPLVKIECLACWLNNRVCKMNLVILVIVRMRGNESERQVQTGFAAVPWR